MVVSDDEAVFGINRIFCCNMAPVIGVHFYQIILRNLENKKTI